MQLIKNAIAGRTFALIAVTVFYVFGLYNLIALAI